MKTEVSPEEYINLINEKIRVQFLQSDELLSQNAEFFKRRPLQVYA